MEEQLNYQPVSFEGIVPVLDVGDPSQAFARSLQGAIQGEQANLNQMQRNAEIESKNLEKRLEGLNKLAKFSQTAYQTYREIDDAVLKNRLAEIFAENKNNPNIDYSEFEADEKEAVDVDNSMSFGITKTLRSKSNLTATDSANAAKLRNYTSLEAIVAHNGRVAGALESYPTALEKWLSNPQFRNIKPGAEYEQVVDEFNKLWGDKTGLSGANPQFLAKYVYPQIRKTETQQRELFTRQFNVKHASEQDQIILQKLQLGLIGLKEAAEISNGLTKSDGKSLRTPDDFWNLISKGEFSTDALKNLGSEIFEVTGKPYFDHPRFQALLRDSRQRLLNDDRIKNAEFRIIARDGQRDLGPDATNEQLEAEYDRQVNDLNIPADIAMDALNEARRSSFEANEIREWTDKINTWLNNNPDKQIPYDVIADAPWQVKQQFKGQMEPNANAATTEELLRKSQAFKDIEKDMKATLKKLVPNMEIASEAAGTTDPANFNSFKTAQLNDIVQRAQVLMLGQASLSLEQALEQAKKFWYADAEKLQAKGKLFDDDKNEFKTAPIHVGQAQAARMMSQRLQRTQLDNLAEGLYESDYKQPPVQGRYSERVRFLARRYGMRPKEIVDLARQQQGLGPMPSTGADDALGMVSQGEMARIASLDSSSVTAALRAQINSGQRLTGDAKSRTIAVGQQLQALGIKGIWQHPDFNYNSGYTGSGKERVGERAGNSYHKYDEALDIGVNGNGERKLDMLYAYLMKNKERFGIAQLLWRTEGHYDHLHVSFK